MHARFHPTRIALFLVFPILAALLSACASREGSSASSSDTSGSSGSSARTASGSMPPPSDVTQVIRMSTTRPSRPINKALVVAVLERNDLRRQMEDEFVRQLKAHGVDAIAGYSILPSPSDEMDREKLKQEAERNGADAVLIAGLVHIERSTGEDPGRAVGGRGDFRAGYPALSYQSYDQPPMTTQIRDVTMETRVFDARSRDLLWDARTRTIIMREPAKDIPQFVRTLVNGMRMDGLLPS
jgi:hypothetical protein